MIVALLSSVSACNITRNSSHVEISTPSETTISDTTTTTYAFTPTPSITATPSPDMRLTERIAYYDPSTGGEYLYFHSEDGDYYDNNVHTSEDDPVLIETYGEQGRLTRRDDYTYSTDTKPHLTEIFEYDENGNMTSFVLHNYGGSPFRAYLDYDEEGRLIGGTSSSSGLNRGDESKQKVEYIYDDQERLDKIVFKIWYKYGYDGDETEPSVLTTSYEYNHEGLLISETTELTKYVPESGSWCVWFDIEEDGSLHIVEKIPGESVRYLYEEEKPYMTIRHRDWPYEEHENTSWGEDEIIVYERNDQGMIVRQFFNYTSEYYDASVNNPSYYLNRIDRTNKMKTSYYDINGYLQYEEISEYSTQYEGLLEAFPYLEYQNYRIMYKYCYE